MKLTEWQANEVIDNMDMSCKDKDILRAQWKTSASARFVVYSKYLDQQLHGTETVRVKAI